MHCYYGRHNITPLEVHRFYCMVLLHSQMRCHVIKKIGQIKKKCMVQVILRTLNIFIELEYFFSHDVASGSDIKPCNKMD